MNFRPPGYEPDGHSWLPYPAKVRNPRRVFKPSVLARAAEIAPAALQGISWRDGTDIVGTTADGGRAASSRQRYLKVDWRALSGAQA